MKLQCTIGESEEILEQRLHLSSVKVLSTEELCEGIYCEVLIIFEVFYRILFYNSRIFFFHLCVKNLYDSIIYLGF